MNGGQGDDKYRLDADAAGGNITLVEELVDGFDLVDLSASSVDVALNLTNGAPQVLSPSMSVKLSETDTFDALVTGPSTTPSWATGSTTTWPAARRTTGSRAAAATTRSTAALGRTRSSTPSRLRARCSGPTPSPTSAPGWTRST